MTENQNSNNEKNNILINDYLTKIYDLKSYISDLKSEIKELKTQIGLLTNRNIALIDYEHNYLGLIEENKSLKKTISKLKYDILNTIKKEKEEKRDISLNLENELIYYKGLNDTTKRKIEASNHIIKLNSIQHNYILQLEKEIEELKQNNINNINILKVEHDLNYKNLKRSMIDFIKKSNIEIQKENTSNIELHSKFSAIQKNEMLNELENQNIQILELIKEKEIKEKKILNLIADNKAVHSVDKILKKKNLKLQKIIKNILEKKTTDKDNINNNNNINKKEELFKTTMEKKDNNKYVELEKEYNDLFIKYYILKDKYDFIKDQEKMFQKKYYGIIRLYDTALKDLLKDEQIIKKKLNININKFMEGNIDTYTKEEKIKIIFMLMKHLLPLIKVQNTEIIKIRNLFNDILIKNRLNLSSKYSGIYSRNDDKNMTQSFYNIKQYMSDFDYSLKKEEHKKNLKSNSIFNTYNKTLNNINSIKKSKEESKSFKSSFFGLNFNSSAIKKKGETKINERNKNSFLKSAANFYKNNQKRKKSEIKINKGMIIDELGNKNSPLQRMMFLNINDNIIKDKNKCLTENNFIT